MAQVTITIPNAVAQRVLDAFAAQYGWTPGSGQTLDVFFKDQLARYIRAVVVEAESSAAAMAAARAARERAEQELGGVG